MISDDQQFQPKTVSFSVISKYAWEADGRTEPHESGYLVHTLAFTGIRLQSCTSKHTRAHTRIEPLNLTAHSNLLTHQWSIGCAPECTHRRPRTKGHTHQIRSDSPSKDVHSRSLLSSQHAIISAAALWSRMTKN